MGLHTSWSKTCLQNTGYGPPPHAVSVQGNTVEVTDRFTYLGSDISSCGRSTPEMFRRIGLGSSIMNQLSWHVYGGSQGLKAESEHQVAAIQRPFCLCVLLYGAETSWTLVKSDEQKLEAFQMSCL